MEPWTPKPPLLSPPGDGVLSKERIFQHIKTLSDPAWRGRDVGTPGLDLAAEYIAAQMKEAGLAPLGEEDSYFLPFGERPYTFFIPEETFLRDDLGNEWRTLNDFFPLHPHANMDASGELVFAGYGQVSDYRKIDVSGKIVLVLLDLPEEMFLLRKEEEARKKYLRAVKLDAEAVIFTKLPSPSGAKPAPLPTYFQRISGKIPVLEVRWEIAEAWISETSESRQEPLSLKREVSFQVREETRKATTRNVVGVLKGSAPWLPAVSIGAHYDTRTGYPGADDNASGTAALLEIMRAMARAPARPARSIIFCAFAEEENGMVGSRALVRQLANPRERIAVMLNLDTIGRLQDQKLYWSSEGVGGRARKLLSAASRDLGLNLLRIEDVFPPHKRRFSSDHASFSQAGVPVFFFFTGLHEDMHTPADTLDKINTDGLQRIARVALRLAYQLALPIPYRPLQERARPGISPVLRP